MKGSTRIARRIAGAVTAGCFGMAVAASAGAVDLRDWGRKLSPSQRFVVLEQFNNQAVLDKETQLVWQAAVAFPGPMSWRWAMLNCLEVSTGGRRGWRLPTADEFTSVLTPGASSMPSVFAGVPSGVYWTATNDPTIVDWAIPVHAPTGIMWQYGYTKTHLLGVWCVRGPGT